MESARRFVYYVAASADGFIARKDGSVDWLEERPAAAYGLADFLRAVDTIVWGRRTFDGSHGRGGLEPFGPRMKHIVLTHRPAPQAADPRVEFSAGPAAELARRLRSEGGQDVWLMGGAGLAASFLDAGALDEMVVHVLPVLLGEGVPLFAPSRRDVTLTLRDVRTFPDGVLRLRYDVTRPG